MQWATIWNMNISLPDINKVQSYPKMDAERKQESLYQPEIWLDFIRLGSGHKNLRP